MLANTKTGRVTCAKIPQKKKKKAAKDKENLGCLKWNRRIRAPEPEGRMERWGGNHKKGKVANKVAVALCTQTLRAATMKLFDPSLSIHHQPLMATAAASRKGGSRSTRMRSPASRTQRTNMRSSFRPHAWRPKSAPDMKRQEHHRRDADGQSPPPLPPTSHQLADNNGGFT